MIRDAIPCDKRYEENVHGDWWWHFKSWFCTTFLYSLHSPCTITRWSLWIIPDFTFGNKTKPNVDKPFDLCHTLSEFGILSEMFEATPTMTNQSSHLPLLNKCATCLGNMSLIVFFFFKYWSESMHSNFNTSATPSDHHDHDHHHPKKKNIY